ncbi:MAG: hypothetical protein M1837_002283 [Sclerophora amabilis]|nr:MAG: hypothetical protein M1837_002283 [Sclerophora amabilis]
MAQYSQYTNNSGHRGLKQTPQKSVSVPFNDSRASLNGVSRDEGADSEWSATGGSKSASRKKKGRQHGKHTDSSALSSSGSRMSSTPQNGVSTPFKPPTTPPKAAYAGATFHASPAPSSLPIPSFFSQSVPELPAANSYSTTTGQSSKGNDISPTRAHSNVVGNSKTVDESPLDIFFKADREEKARAKLGKASDASEGSPTTTLLQSPLRDEDSPLKNRRNHSRNPTDSSISDIFPLEMDGTSATGRTPDPAFATPYKVRMNAIRPNTAPTTTTAMQSPDNDHGRKTQALKEMLMASSPHRAVSNPSRHEESRELPESPSSSPDTQARETTQNFPGSGMPGQNKPAFNSHVSGVANKPTHPTARPSNLRKEVTILKNPEHSEAAKHPSSSSPGHSKQNTFAISREILDAHINASPSRSPAGRNTSSTTYSPSPPRKSVDPTNQEPVRNNSHIQSLEDNLRRMLKLGGRDGSTLDDTTLAPPTSSAFSYGAVTEPGR